MTATTLAQSRAFAVWFKELGRWSVKSFHGSHWQRPASEIKKLACALERRSESIDKASFELKPEHFVSLRFSGEIEPRNLHGKSEFKGILYFAYAGDLIYSKIDVRNGAIGIIPANIRTAAVTSEFPVYRIKPDVASPEYIQLVFRTQHFRRIINGMVSGASGRKRVQSDDLENVEIPLPALAEQKAIVARWRNAQSDIAAARERAEKKQTEIESRFFSDLGLQLPDRATMPKAFAVLWRDFLRWGVSFNYLNQCGSDLSQCIYPIVALGSIVDLVQYGTSEKANSNQDGVAVMRMNNILNGELDLRNLKHLSLSERDRKRLLLRNGDILFNRTNSKELVGKCAVFHSQEEYVFASYLIRVRIDDSKADPDFLAYAINSPIGRQQIDALSRQIIGQANINSGELRGLQVPLPPLSVQKEIVERIAAQRREIAQERAAAEALAHDIDAEIDALILGSKRLN